MKSIGIIAITVLIASVSITSISAQSQYDIPAWVKGIAGFWAEDKITDGEFGEGLSFLIDNEIIKIPLIQELQNQINQLKTENSELRSKLDLPIPDPIPEPKISITIGTDKDSYESGDIISVKGLVRNYSSNDITLVINNPQGDTVTLDQLTPRSNGLFTVDFPIGPTFDSSGTYKIIANHKGHEVTTTFEFTIVEPEVTLSVKTDVSTYGNGEDVIISGVVNPIVEHQSVTLMVISPEGETIMVRQTTPNSDGTFSDSFVAGGNLWSSSGEYRLQFGYNGTLETIEISFVK